MAALKETLEALAKRYGHPVVKKGSEIDAVRKIPLDIPMYDYIFGGGVPVNRIAEFYGDFSSLKSYACYKAIAKFQKFDWGNNVPDVITGVTFKTLKSRSKDEALEGFTFAEIDKVTCRRGYKPKNEVIVKRCVLVDIEGTYDSVWGERLGIDNEALLHLRPGSLNEAIDITIMLLSLEEVSLIVFDSMIAIGCDAEADASMENEQMAINARFWNKATRGIQRAMNNNEGGDITLMAINGAYEKVGVSFGDPEKVKNGKAFSLAKSISIRSSALKEQKIKLETGAEVTAGRNITIRNKKNKVGAPLREGSFYFSFIDDGLLKAGETDIYQQLIELALRFGVINRSGAWYSFGETKIASGVENVKQKLKSDPELYNEIKTLTYKFF